MSAFSIQYSISAFSIQKLNIRIQYSARQHSVCIVQIGGSAWKAAARGWQIYLKLLNFESKSWKAYTEMVIQMLRVGRSGLEYMNVYIYIYMYILGIYI